MNCFNKAIAITFASATLFAASGNAFAQGAAQKAAPKAAPSAAKAAPSGDPIIFGMDEDSTGPGAVNARVSGRAVRDAIDYVNEHGGILGRPVKLIVENDESDATKSPAVARKLIEQGAQVLFFATAGSAIIQAKPIVK